jgi:hypothetical protein
MFRRFNIVSLGPGEFFFEGQAATVALPALFRTQAPARVIVTGIGSAVRWLFAARRWEREADCHHQVTDEQKHHQAILPTDAESETEGIPHTRW